MIAKDVESFIEHNQPIRPLKILSEDDIHSLVNANIKENKMLIDLYSQLDILPSTLSPDTATSVFEREVHK